MLTKNIFWVGVLLLLLAAAGCGSKDNRVAVGEKEGASAGQSSAEPQITQQTEPRAGQQAKPDVSYKITFIELGSVKCIPCKMMQPVVKQIEEEYPEVKVVFYDVWTTEGRKYGQKYGVRVIPTQVFLDKDGKEYFRHEGFFPKEDLEKVLVQGGVSKKEK